MKVYNKNGDSMNAVTEQLAILEAAGWSKTKPEPEVDKEEEALLTEELKEAEELAEKEAKEADDAQAKADKEIKEAKDAADALAEKAAEVAGKGKEIVTPKKITIKKKK